MRQLVLSWQRLLVDGMTCPRCRDTEKELEKAYHFLQEALRPLGVAVALEKGELSLPAFHDNPLASNRILINGRSLEEWLGARTGKSECCGVCGPEECRTLEVENTVYERIPWELIVQGALRALEAILPQCTQCGPCCAS